MTTPIIGTHYSELPFVQRQLSSTQEASGGTLVRSPLTSASEVYALRKQALLQGVVGTTLVAVTLYYFFLRK
jgi:hypothetical protein